MSFRGGNSSVLTPNGRWLAHISFSCASRIDNFSRNYKKEEVYGSKTSY